MTQEAVVSLIHSSEFKRIYSPGSETAKKRLLIRSLQDPPQEFSKRQELLDGVPNYLVKECSDLFPPLSDYCEDVLGIDVPTEKIPEAALYLRQNKIVPVLKSRQAHYKNGSKVINTV